MAKKRDAVEVIQLISVDYTLIRYDCQVALSKDGRPLEPSPVCRESNTQHATHRGRYAILNSRVQRSPAWPRKSAPMSDDAPYAVEIRYDVRIPVRDGLALSANLFLPVAQEAGERFPAILEMIPYRKDDWRYCFDHQLMSYFAQRGYVGCRLDVRGTGSSPGLARDEYTPEETQDGYDAVEWLAAQPWCNGNVGMWGISYGGFTAIQVAMLRPPALKAVVPVS